MNFVWKFLLHLLNHEDEYDIEKSDEYERQERASQDYRLHNKLQFYSKDQSW